MRPLLAMYDSESSWNRWMVDDQRPFSDRPDMLTFVSEPLTQPVSISGPVLPISSLHHRHRPRLGGEADRRLSVRGPVQPAARRLSADGVRRHHARPLSRGPASPKPIAAGRVLPYRVRLPQANHSFQPGHRIMVQIQSSWFPLYDRNPQSYVDNFGKAPRSAYRAATHRIHFAPGQASFVELPVVRR